MKESSKKLQKVSEEFSSGTFFTPVVGAEIEFYLLPLPDGVSNPVRIFMSNTKEDMNMRNGLQTHSCQTNAIPENITDIIAARCHAAAIPIFDVKKEEGAGQYEVALLHVNNPVLLADRICELTILLKKIATEFALQADFSAKPFADDYGNSLHVHVSILDKNGNNILQKNGDDESAAMLHAIAGLLEKMPESMPVFAPYEACYARLLSGKDAPSTISWGGNNRTVALRLPTTTADPESRRIEHRVAAADSDPYLVIAAILSAIQFGFEEKLLPKSEKIYGNAGLEIYNLPPFVKVD